MCPQTSPGKVCIVFLLCFLIGWFLWVFYVVLLVSIFPPFFLSALDFTTCVSSALLIVLTCAPLLSCINSRWLGHCWLPCLFLCCLVFLCKGLFHFCFVLFKSFFYAPLRTPQVSWVFFFVLVSKKYSFLWSPSCLCCLQPHVTQHIYTAAYSTLSTRLKVSNVANVPPLSWVGRRTVCSSSWV